MNVDTHTLVNHTLIALILLSTVLERLLGIPPIAGQIFILFLFGISCFRGFADKNYYRCFIVTPIAFWGIWVAYSVVNWCAAGIMPRDMSAISFLSGNLLLPFVMLVLVYYEACKNMKATIMTLLISFVIYMTLGVMMQDFGTRQGLDWSARGGLILGNHLPLNACTLVFVALFANATGVLKSKYMYLTVALALLVILLIATRKALGAVVIMAVCFTLAKNIGRKSWTGITRLVLALLLLGIALVYVKDKTLMGKRLENIELTLHKPNKSGSEIINLLGDRVPHYYLGWEVFKKHPVTGVGLNNVPILYHFPYPLHTEYMTQLAEGGIIGTALWLIFISGLFYTVFRAVRYRQLPVLLICFSGILYILFIDFTSWTYAIPHYFVAYGLIIAYCKPIWLQRMHWLKEHLSWHT